MPSDFLPSNLPPELANVAFSSGDEVAWSRDHAVLAVEWFGSLGYAILGTELWVMQTDGIQSLPFGHDGMGGVYGNTVNRQKGEAWNSFVARSTAQTRADLQTFNRSNIYNAPFDAQGEETGRCQRLAGFDAERICHRAHGGRNTQGSVGGTLLGQGA